jgi:hypothetical protein
LNPSLDHLNINGDVLDKSEQPTLDLLDDPLNGDQLVLDQLIDHLNGE